jgi:hypothetical protein
VGQDEDLAGPLHQGLERDRIRKGGGHRLVADDVDAGLEEGGGGVEMDMVGGDDRNDVDGVLALGLGLGHLGEAAIGAGGIDAEFEARRLRFLGRAGEAAGDQLVAIVQPGGDPVHTANERALPAADHAEAKASLGGCTDPAALAGHWLTPCD